MHPSFRILPAVLHALLIGSSSTPVAGQPKAQACFFSEDFESGILPAGWDGGPAVERQDPEGNGLGEFVPAWTIGTSAQADAGGFFPVPDIPTGNRSLMANDDAAPCNCAMADVSMTTPSMDLTGRTGVALQCRVFHEQAMGGGPASIEASVNGGTWISLVTVPVLSGDWQDLFVNLSAFDGQPDLRLRFRWSDGGTWASGFALDDLCLSERYTVDLSVLHVFPNDRSISPFTLGDQSMYYRMRPLEQAGPLTVTAEVMNSGTAPLPNVQVSTSLFFNGNDFGPFSTAEVIDLAPGERRLVVIPTGWVPDAPGELDIFVQGGPGQGMDEDVNDNSGLYIQSITGPGWENGYGAMACDDGVAQGSVGGQQAFIAGNRLELIDAGSVPRGISVVLDGATEEGAQVRGILFDANLAFVDTTARITLTSDDIFLIGTGAPILLPFASAAELPAGDYFVGLQHLEGEEEVHVATSGNGPVGAAILMQGINFDVTYLRSTPMVRLHLSEFGVGIDGPDQRSITGLGAHPVPMKHVGTLVMTLDRDQEIRTSMTDATGRLVRQGSYGIQRAGTVRLPLDVEGLRPGLYLVTVHGAGFRVTTRVVVE